MSGKHAQSHPPSCNHVRLAESSVAAIDACRCGTLQLHLGAITLRLTQDAATELLGTLGYAVAMLAEHCVLESVHDRTNPAWRVPGRGES